MRVLEGIIKIIQYKVETPKILGPYHVICFCVMIAATVLFVLKFKDASDKTIRRLLFVTWCVIVMLEILKQIQASYSLGGAGDYVWAYRWYDLPFQFCSTPYYCLPFIIFLPDGFFRRAFVAFFAGFSLFAGLVVMIYPGDVFSATLFLNLQTMIHHGAMVSIGVLMAVHNRRNMNIRYFLGSLVVFYFFAVTALVLNEVIYYTALSDSTTDAVNFFFISRHYPSTLPLLSDIYKALPYGWYLVVYFAGFTLASALIYFIEMGSFELNKKIKEAIGKRKSQNG